MRGVDSQEGRTRGWRRWLAFEPIRHERWEVVLLRLGLAYVAWQTFLGGSEFDGQPHPNGLARFVDLTFLSNDQVEGVLRPLAGVSLLAYVIGVPAAASLLVPTWFGIGLFTLKNSQGAIGHSFQVVHLCLLAAWLAGVWTVASRWRRRPLPHGFSGAQLELDWARQALAAGYVVSAITKLVESGGLWFRDSQYFALHLIKNNDMKYYGTLEAGVQKLEWLPEWMMGHPLASQLFFGLALPLELFAYLGCRNRRLALLFGVGLTGFHLCVKQLTQLDFVYNMELLLVLMVNPAWWFAWMLRPRQGTAG
jgi:hypothetical protein